MRNRNRPQARESSHFATRTGPPRSAPDGGRPPAACPDLAGISGRPPVCGPRDSLLPWSLSGVRSATPLGIRSYDMRETLHRLALTLALGVTAVGTAALVSGCKS